MNKYKKWNENLLLKGYKTVEEYIDLWNASGKDKISEGIVDNDYRKFIAENKKGLTKQSRKWVFTIHKPFLYYDSVEEIKDLFNDWKAATRVIFSIETGKKDQTLHIQGFVEGKNPIPKARIISKLKNKDIHLEPAKGEVMDQVKYITKDEGHAHEKIIYQKGEWDINIISREDMSVSEFADFVVKNNIQLTKNNIDKYCSEFRKNPTQQTIDKIANLVNLRRGTVKISSIRPMQTIVFFGESGNGKSLLSEWIMNKINLDYELIFKKAAADKQSENSWYDKSCILQDQAFYTEVDVTFPKKRYLLSFLDRKDRLNIKGGERIINNFSHLIINATSTSMRYIYNATQDHKSFVEIYRRLLNGKFYFIKANEQWNNIKINDFTADELIEKYPPYIYEVITTNQNAVDLYNKVSNIDNDKDFKIMNSFKIVKKDDGDYLIEDTPHAKIIEKIRQVSKEEVFNTYKDQLSYTNMKAFAAQTPAMEIKEFKKFNDYDTVEAEDNDLSTESVEDFIANFPL